MTSLPDACITRQKKQALQIDVYTRVTEKIIAGLEQGVRPWLKPWNAEHAAGKITRPLRHNGQPYSGINVLMLWCEAMDKGYTAPLWMTFRQAQDLGGHVRKGEHGSLVVYANTFTKTEIDEDTGEELERDIPFMKGYTVFNVEQIEGLPAHYYATAVPPTLEPGQRIERAERFLASTGAAVKPRRRPGVLRHRERPYPNAAFCVLPRSGELLRNPPARNLSLDAAPVPPGPGFRPATVGR